MCIYINTLGNGFPNGQEPFFFGVLWLEFMWYVYKELAHVHNIQLLLPQINQSVSSIVSCFYVMRFEPYPAPPPPPAPAQPMPKRTRSGQLYNHLIKAMSLKNFYWLILERERLTHTHISLLFHLFRHSLVDSCMCSDQGSNPQPWCIGTMP